MHARTGEFAAGWRSLAGALLGIALGMSSLYFYSLGIFLKPLVAEFHWGRGEASLGLLVGTACAAIAAWPAGRLVDRVGSLRVGVASLSCLALGFVALALFTRGLASFVAIMTVLSVLTAGASPLPFTRVVVAAFDRRRGLALGIALSGTGLGAILVPMFLPGYVAGHGWRAGYLALAAVIALLLPVLALLLRGAREPAAAATAAAAPAPAIIGTRAFALLGACFACSSIAVLGPVVHFVPMLGDAGLAPTAIGRIAGLIGVAAIIGRLGTGWLLDHARAKSVTAALFAFAAAGLAMLAVGGSRAAPGGALVLGLTVGMEVDLLSFLAARYFGTRTYGQAYGALYTLFLVGGATGPALTGFLFDLSGSYRIALWTSSALLAVASGVALGLPREPGARDAHGDHLQPGASGFS